MLEPGTYIMRLSSWKQFLAGYDGNGNPINKAVMQAKPYRSWSVRMYGFNIKVMQLKLSIPKKNYFLVAGALLLVQRSLSKY